MSSHLTVGDPRPAFVPKNKFRIYSMLYCPFAQRARLVIAAKGLTDCDIVNIKLRKDLPGWYTSINPLKKVPAIEFPNGATIYESLIVSDLLDDMYPDKRLHPSDPVAKAKQRLFVETFGNTVIPMLYKYGREKTEENKEALVKSLSECDKYLANEKSQFFAGEHPGMVDYMIWPFLERLPMTYQLASEVHPNLVSYCTRMQNVPAVKEIALSLDIYKKFSEGYQSEHPNYDLV